MDNCFGQHGWKEFNQNRKDILSELDKILEQTKNKPVQVAHGQGVEAFLRKWLSEFLPKKYGVTSGYIIPNLYDDNLNLYHYDVVIYNQIESPILWTEGNYDQSEQGKFRAIPAKHVVAVYEVKSRLTKTNVKDAIDKLKQTESFRDQLNPLYSCGMIFIDLKEMENNKESIIKELINVKDVPGFRGGMVLRYEGDDTSTGIIRLFENEKEQNVDHQHYKPIAKPIDSLNIFLTEEGDLQIEGQGEGAKMVATSESNWSVSKTYGISCSEGNSSVHLDWSRSNFSDFCIDLVSSLEGLAFNDKNRPSFGQVFDRIERKKAPEQGDKPQDAKPFLTLNLCEGNEHGEKLSIDEKSITFMVSIENIGNATAILSDDSFKHKCELPSGKTAIKPVRLQIESNKSEKSLVDLQKQEPLVFPYRVVYYSDHTNKDFVALEKQVTIFNSEIQFEKIDN